MPRQKIIVGLDIGSQNIRAAVAQAPKEEGGNFQILGVGQIKSQGVRRGLIVDAEEVIKNIQEAVKNAERTSGLIVEGAYVNLGGEHLGCRESKGVIAVSRADGEIAKEDIARAISAATAISLGANREIVQVIPKRFSVDNEAAVKDPIGMSGVRLEVDVLLIDGASPFIKNLMKCFGEAGVDIEALVPSPLAAAKAVLDKRQKELGVLVLDIGAGTTGLCVFEEGDLVYACVLPVGSGHITNDLAIGLRCDIDVAEKIKLQYGSVAADEINKKETIDLEKLGGQPGRVSRQKATEIIEARASEIFELAYKKLKQIDRVGLLPAGVVLVGGGAKLPGLVDLAKEKLRLPSQIGFPSGFDGIVDQVDDPSFAAVLGLIFWSQEQSEELRQKRLRLPGFSRAMPFFGKFKNWFKGFLP